MEFIRKLRDHPSDVVELRVEEQADIADAILTGDPEGAGEKMAFHMRHTPHRLLGE